MEPNKRQTSWLLKRNQLSLLAAILPPIALIVVQVNKHKLSERTVKNIRFFASLMTCLWLIKLLPHHWITKSLLLLLIGLILGALIFTSFRK